MAIPPVYYYTSEDYNLRLESYEPKEKPPTFDSFNEKYEGKKFYNISQLDQANKFLLGEYLGGKKSNPTNGEFISFLASQFLVILFVEGRECMVEIQDESTIQRLMDRLCIAPEVCNKIRFFGWDATQEIEKAFQLQNKLFECASVLQINDQMINLIKDQIPGLMDGDIDRSLLPKALTMWISVLEGNFPKVKESCEKIQTLQLQLDAEIINTFPVRTEKMISSLQQADGLILTSTSEIKMVWTCWEGHLRDLRKDLENLDPLRDELHKHKAVAMAPYQIDKVEEYSFEEQRRLITDGKMGKNYGMLNLDPEQFLAEWEYTIDLLKRQKERS
ncbi:MAG: hypothetical protein WA347_01420 [Rhabdochlamydiaceae bacterium]|jgi:hypothetical protein